MLADDLLFSCKLLWKRPGMSLLVIAALVLGIGVNTAVFSVVNAVLLRPLPVFEPERVVNINAKVNPTGGTLGISYPEYLDWKAQSHSFEGIAVRRAFSFYSSGNGHPEHLKGIGISASGFKVFGVATVLGRDFTESDDHPEAERVVILNHAFFERKFGGDPVILERSLSLDNQSYKIIGVLQPTTFSALQYPDVWVPNGRFLDEKMMKRASRYYFPVARLKSTVSQSQAQAEMETIAARLAAQYPATNKDMGIRFVGLAELFTADSRKPLALLLTASSLIFLLACVNVVIVFVSSTIDRRKELSVRLALGASRGRLVRLLMAPALILVTVGSILGLAVAKAGLLYFLHRFPSAVWRFQETTIDYQVIGFMAALALGATLLATVLPGWYATRLNINDELKGECSWSPFSRYRSLRQGALIVFEVSLASALSLVSGLLIKSFYEVAKIDMGFNSHQVISFQVNLPPRYKGTDQAMFYKRAIDKLSSLPGVSLSSGISSLPLTTQGNVTTLQVDTQSPAAAEHPLVENESVLPGFFQTMNMPLLQGRDFTNADRNGMPSVAIVDEVLAAKFWPGQSPLGKRLRLAEVTDTTLPWREVVGVVRQIKHFGPEAKVRWMQVYAPQYQEPTPVLSFVIKTTLPDAAVKAAAEKAIRELDSDLPLDNFQTMDDLMETYLASRKVSLLLLSGFAGIAVLLGTIGIYGVVASSVVRRRREIAIRIALGATPRGIMLLIVRTGLLSTLAGILIGFGLVISFTRLLASFLFGITTLDPTVYLLCAFLIFALALVSSLTPARSVIAINPQEILRE